MIRERGVVALRPVKEMWPGSGLCANQLAVSLPGNLSPAGCAAYDAIKRRSGTGCTESEGFRQVLFGQMIQNGTNY